MTRKIDVRQVLLDYDEIKVRASSIANAVGLALGIVDIRPRHDPDFVFDDVTGEENLIIGDFWYKNLHQELIVPIDFIPNMTAKTLKVFVRNLVSEVDILSERAEWDLLQRTYDGRSAEVARYEELKKKYGDKHDQKN